MAFYKWVLLAGVIVIAVASIALVFGGVTPTANASLYDDFAKCLNEKGVKMYGAFWCSHCNNQKALFGSSWSYMNYIECSNADSSQNKVCSEAGITGYPTWELPNGQRMQGELTLDQLSKLSNCTLR
ncbi:MAG: hypothetical protein HY362_00500 [Candidatus Aenigmarchaeota archaeon]|nr:hypothetical protein [Candidatus Aenigmarchaeota archaeon]